MAHDPVDRPGTDRASHLVTFHDDPDAHVRTVADFVRAGLHRGEAVAIVAEQRLRDAVELDLADRGVDLAAAGAAGRYVAIDAGHLLAEMSLAGQPDRHRFKILAGDLLSELCTAGAGVRIYGEMVALLWDRGEVTAALALEDWWNELAARAPFSLLCGYPMGQFGDDASTVTFREVCRRHVGVSVPQYRDLADAPAALDAGILWRHDD